MEKNKAEAKKTNKTLMNMLTGFVVALIITAASYGYWHDTNIRVTFQANSETEVEYQLFYMNENSKWFNGKQVVKHKTDPGVNFLKVVLPIEHLTRFRFDFGSKPGMVTIKDLKILGDNTVELTDFDNYGYYHINNHKVNEDGSLTIVSKEKDPFMIINEKLDILPGDDYDWTKMWLIAIGSFIVAFLLATLINKKK